MLQIFEKIAEEDVYIERDRRLASGFLYDFKDIRGVHLIGTTEEDMKGWINEVTPAANAMIASDMPNSFIVIDTNTGMVRVTAIEWQKVLLAAFSFRQPIYFKSFVLASMNPIPLDYKEDKWWN